MLNRNIRTLCGRIQTQNNRIEKKGCSSRSAEGISGCVCRGILLIPPKMGDSGSALPPKGVRGYLRGTLEKLSALYLTSPRRERLNIGLRVFLAVTLSNKFIMSGLGSLVRRILVGPPHGSPASPLRGVEVAHYALA